MYEKPSKDSKEYATEIINYEKKMIPLMRKISLIKIKKFVTHTKNDNNTDDDYKKRDHYHYTGKYREAAHNICNLRYKIP